MFTVHLLADLKHFCLETCFLSDQDHRIEPLEMNLPGNSKKRLAINEIRFVERWGPNSWCVEHHPELPYQNARRPHVQCQGVCSGQIARISQIRKRKVGSDAEPGNWNTAISWQVEGVKDRGHQAHFTVGFGVNLDVEAFAIEYDG